jgi:DNA-binding NarL/FixJ family response regulator
MIRVCVVEDQTLVRVGLVRLLSLASDIEVVSEASDGDDARVLIRKTTPDVVLLDVRMPQASGLDLLEYLQNQQSSPACILLTTFDDNDALLQGIRLGARGYLLKDVTLEVLTDAIRRVSRGETLFNPTLTVRLLREMNPNSQRAPSTAAEKLTDRESEILRLMSGGYSNREIAEALGIRRHGKESRVEHPLQTRGP